LAGITETRMSASREGLYDSPNIFFAILASPQDWKAHGNLYDAMLAYADSYQYFLSADFRHVLVLDRPMGIVEGQRLFSIPFPDGWKERLGKDGQIVIAPETVL